MAEGIENAAKGQSPTHEQIEKRAFELYLECGSHGGHELEHWLLAEQELIQGNGKVEETVPEAISLKDEKEAVMAAGRRRQNQFA